MKLSVREATAADARRIRDVHVASIEALGRQGYNNEQVGAWARGRSPTDYPLESNETYVIVAERDGQVVGFGWMKPDADEYVRPAVDGEITAVYVHPSVARRGVGSRIYEALESHAERENVDSLGLWASRNAVPFYESHGYERVDEHVHEFDDGVAGTVVEMRKYLDE